MSERRKKQRAEDRSGEKEVELEIGCYLVPLLWGCVTLAGSLTSLSLSRFLHLLRGGLAFLPHRVNVRIKRGHWCMLDMSLTQCTQLFCFLKGSFSLSPDCPAGGK